MTLANEMTRLAAEFGAAHEARLSTVRAIRSGVQRDLAAVQAALRRTSMDHAKRVRADLDGIFSEAAAIRGRAVDMIEGFATEREGKTQALRTELEAYASDLETAVAKLLDAYGHAREEMGTREAVAREAYLQDLRTRTQMLMANAAKFIDKIRMERVRARKTWQRHMPAQSARPRRRDAARPAADKAAADKAAADKAVSDKAAVDKAASEKAAMDKAASDKAAVDKAASEKAAVDKAASDKAASEKAAVDKAAADKAASDKAAVNKAASDKAAADKTAAERVAAAKASTRREAASKTAAEPAGKKSKI